MRRTVKRIVYSQAIFAGPGGSMQESEVVERVGVVEMVK